MNELNVLPEHLERQEIETAPTDAVTLPDGRVVQMGCVMPKNFRFGAVPTWSDANEKIPEDEWTDVDVGENTAPDPYDQNPQSSCTGNGTAGGFGTAWAASGQPRIRFSAGFTYAQCNGGTDQGAMVRDVVAQLFKLGCPPESVVGSHTIFLRDIPQSAYPEAAKQKGLEIYQCEDFVDIGSAHLRGFVVIYGICLGGTFFNTRSDGVVPEFDGRATNGHCMFSRGLKLLPGERRRRSITQNSWGRQFGFNGICYVPQSYFQPTIRSRWGDIANLDAYAVRAVQGGPADQGLPSGKVVA